MSAPTESEIRQAIEAGIEALDLSQNVYDSRMLDAVLDSGLALTRCGWAENFHPPADHPGTLWADLTEEENDELHALMDVIIDQVDERARQMLIDECVAATVTFAKAHPDIPRGRWKPSSSAPSDRSPKALVTA